MPKSNAEMCKDYRKDQIENNEEEYRETSNFLNFFTAIKNLKTRIIVFQLLFIIKKILIY